MSAEGKPRALTGTHRCALDEKGRLNFPAKLREKIGQNFWITQWLDDCLIALPEYQWEKIEEILAERGMVEGREFSAFFFSAAEEVSPDKQGRVLVSSYLREHIGLEKEAVVVGMGSYAEIWLPDEWEKYKAGFKDRKNVRDVLRQIGI